VGEGGFICIAESQIFSSVEHPIKKKEGNSGQNLSLLGNPKGKCKSARLITSMVGKGSGCGSKTECLQDANRRARKMVILGITENKMTGWSIRKNCA